MLYLDFKKQIQKENIRKNKALRFGCERRTAFKLNRQSETRLISLLSYSSSRGYSVCFMKRFSAAFSVCFAYTYKYVK